jgi:hypothetical protein
MPQNSGFEISLKIEKGANLGQNEGSHSLASAAKEWEPFCVNIAGLHRLFNDAARV